MTAGRGVAAAGLGRRGRPDIVVFTVTGQVEQMLTFSVVELQRAGHRLQHRLRRAGQMAAFESGVIVHADPRQHGNLLPAQARDASLVTEAGQPSLFRCQPGSATGQELLDVLAAIHILTLRPVPLRKQDLSVHGSAGPPTAARSI